MAGIEPSAGDDFMFAVGVQIANGFDAGCPVVVEIVAQSEGVSEVDVTPATADDDQVRDGAGGFVGLPFDDEAGCQKVFAVAVNAAVAAVIVSSVVVSGAARRRGVGIKRGGVWIKRKARRWSD